MWESCPVHCCGALCTCIACPSDVLVCMRHGLLRDGALVQVTYIDRAKEGAAYLITKTQDALEFTKERVIGVPGTHTDTIGTSGSTGTTPIAEVHHQRLQLCALCPHQDLRCAAATDFGQLHACNICISARTSDIWSMMFLLLLLNFTRSMCRASALLALVQPPPPSLPRLFRPFLF